MLILSISILYFDKIKPDLKDGDFNDKYGSWWGIDNEGENICSVSTAKDHQIN